MVTDTGGVNDQSFNQSAWQGMQNLKQNYGDKVKVSYIESKQEADYASNMDNMVDMGNNVVFGIGFAMADAVESAGKVNPNVPFVGIDITMDNIPKNLTMVKFKSEEGSFLSGYIAALTTKTNKVGFVGGMKGDIIDQFEYGYKAGVDYASVELKKNIEVISQYTDSFADNAKGKAVANKIISQGADVVFHASGGCGAGVISAAETAKVYAIGVDIDQAYLSPNYVLTSSLKKISVAVEDISQRMMKGEDLGGKQLVYGASEGAVGIPEDHHLMGEDTYKKAKHVEEIIASGAIKVPYNAETYSKYDKNAGHQ
eukprot:TRINITY_DN0_c178_g1_i3.p1 TRINITY_DN0_c178_g1~~TRINITY_DN0_c178_g1_i3.p1  ORF type:complete len:313 (+),score=-16.61 TRINITY_DN0_c178_g1_i3:266-1204(+)